MNFYELVPHLLNLYPEWTEWEIVSFLEEKLARPVHPEDQTTVRALYLRHTLLERGFAASEESSAVGRERESR